MSNNTAPIVIAGGGIGGLSAAVALQELSKPILLLERSSSFSEVGAGIQLSPNVWFCLRQWGLEEALRECVSFPHAIIAKSTIDGRTLSHLDLTDDFKKRFGGEPYSTILRADLHSLLSQRVKQLSNIQVALDHTVQSFEQPNSGPLNLSIKSAATIRTIETEALIGADGVQSMIRKQMLKAEGGETSFTGHLAYRGLIQQSILPQHLRSEEVTVWLGPSLHAVCYPVRRGELMNIVFIIEAASFPEKGQYDLWDLAACTEDVLALSHDLCTPLKDLLQAVSSHGTSHAGNPWRLWPLNGRPPLKNANQMARGRVALLGDAAHPMLPYLAQGAGMAIEDSYQLQKSLSQAGIPIQEQLLHYAKSRFERNAKVQKQAMRNGRIFHLSGPMRIARDSVLSILGSQLMSSPWLYQPQWTAQEPTETTSA